LELAWGEGGKKIKTRPRKVYYRRTGRDGTVGHVQDSFLWDENFRPMVVNWDVRLRSRDSERDTERDVEATGLMWEEVNSSCGNVSRGRVLGRGLCLIEEVFAFERIIKRWKEVGR